MMEQLRLLAVAEKIFDFPGIPAVIQDDSNAAIQAAEKGYTPMSYVDKTQKVRYGFVHDVAVNCEQLNLHKCDTRLNTADVMTKGLDVDTFRRHIANMGILLPGRPTSVGAGVMRVGVPGGLVIKDADAPWHGSLAKRVRMMCPAKLIGGRGASSSHGGGDRSDDRYWYVPGSNGHYLDSLDTELATWEWSESRQAWRRTNRYMPQAELYSVFHVRYEQQFPETQVRSRSPAPSQR
jgi:hypothetical protein